MQTSVFKRRHKDLKSPMTVPTKKYKFEQPKAQSMMKKLDENSIAPMKALLLKSEKERKDLYDITTSAANQTNEPVVSPFNFKVFTGDDSAIFGSPDPLKKAIDLTPNIEKDAQEINLFDKEVDMAPQDTTKRKLLSDDSEFNPIINIEMKKECTQTEEKEKLIAEIGVNAKKDDSANKKDVIPAEERLKTVSVDEAPIKEGVIKNN